MIVVQELEIGTLLAEHRNPPQGAILRAWLDGQVLPAFSERIRPIRDGLIAATALVHGMTAITRNVADFAPTGVPIFNPWNHPST